MGRALGTSGGPNAAAALQEQEVCGLINMEERDDGKQTCDRRQKRLSWFCGSTGSTEPRGGGERAGLSFTTTQL